MKVIWESEDIVCGQRVGSTKRSETWIIGYLVSAPSDEGYAVISLEDGMIAKVGTQGEIAALFNRTEDAPLELIQRPRRKR